MLGWSKFTGLQILFLISFSETKCFHQRSTRGRKHFEEIFPHIILFLFVVSMIIDAVNKGPEESLHLVEEHWKDLLLQYIGLLTAVIVGLLLAIFLPIIGWVKLYFGIISSFSCLGLFVCCCRCAGRCGVYPDTYYDKVSSREFLFFFFLLMQYFTEV